MNLRVSKGGQISLPAEIRRRWATDSLVVEDLGDRVILRPIPANPVAAATASFPSRGMTADQARARLRREEIRTQERKRAK